MDKSQVFVYLLNINNIDENELFDEFGQSFEEKRLLRINRCKNIAERKRLICTGYFLNTVLAQFWEDTPKIAYGKKDKPYLQNCNDLYFNISHSGDYIMIGVSGQEIGLDIQKEVNVKDSLVQRIISTEEWAKLDRVGLNSSILCWCIKESYSKLTGAGIGKDFKEITFDLDKKNDDYLEISIFDNNEKAAFGMVIPAPNGYVASVTARERFFVEGV